MGQGRLEMLALGKDTYRGWHCARIPGGVSTGQGDLEVPVLGKDTQDNRSKKE